MRCFVCTVASGHLTLLEHMAAKWLTKEHLDDVDWLPADRTIVQWVKEYLDKACLAINNL